MIYIFNYLTTSSKFTRRLTKNLKNSTAILLSIRYFLHFLYFLLRSFFLRTRFFLFERKYKPLSHNRNIKTRQVFKYLKSRKIYLCIFSIICLQGLLILRFKLSSFVLIALLLLIAHRLPFLTALLRNLNSIKKYNFWIPRPCVDYDKRVR